MLHYGHIIRPLFLHDCDIIESSLILTGIVSSPVVGTGPSASGVPGEVRGFRKAWNKYGRLLWKDLVQPAIDLAKKGFRFGYAAHAAANRSSTLPYIKKDPGLR